VALVLHVRNLHLTVKIDYTRTMERRGRARGRTFRNPFSAPVEILELPENGEVNGEKHLMGLIGEACEMNFSHAPGKGARTGVVSQC
jgi:hypothetical protein